MIRPCFLVVDREFSGSISTRKLVIETAKFNVLTAYSGSEALDMFRRFPAVSGVILDGGLVDVDSADVVRAIKQAAPKMPVIMILGPGSRDVPEADHRLESFNPGKLLQILQKLEPESAAEIEARNEELSRKESGQR